MKTTQQYGVRTTWSDGHSEIRETRDRFDAEHLARMNTRSSTAPGESHEAVVRTVTTTDWTTVPTS